MTPRQWHHAGTDTDDRGRPRGLCWCGWRGDSQHGDRPRLAARRDANRHVTEAGA
ncbi:hypothetical protein GCM10023201_41230 [Actinomycetospora corticicola]|uniref:Uncharacterized protein n=1 Tax=Actinomycetospora corticicola TaxID=663602 RepID=A0A7Y9J623_9PSEU|nr:hypothetical protein [Actinomycetospora corticicola]NYD36790.1 hypothetical protein [Actinomycetospora corticicola]